jgi:hypothetical protein
VNQRDRDRHERNQERQSPALPSEGRASAVPRNVWLDSGAPLASSFGVVWLKRPMPDGQWPVDQRAPRDDTFSWWVRSHCGHPGGRKEWAFYEEAYADMYEHVFRADPCRYTRCPERRMIENDGRRRWASD